ncbi:MAG: hypothetical protein NDP13_01880 [Crenarchaeota archaeon]|nr:hypothetical protein [Thermoproteota archaeon]MCR8455621.1 hypothetical protein [Thermoproteota archaeon]MCR8501447.1 hypothetical protein [Thermoproteota archaeon]
MDIKSAILNVVIGLILLSVFLLCMLPPIILIKYYQLHISEDVIQFAFGTLKYLLLLFGVSFGSFLFIPGFLFRIARLTPKEGEYELTVKNKEVFKWILAQGLYTISLIAGRMFIHAKLLVFKLFGAKIGKGVLFQGWTTDPFLTEVGDFSVIGGGAKILAHIADKPGRIIFRRVKIGKFCLIGFNALIMPGAVLDDYVILGAYTLIPKDAKLDRGLWVGIPARKIRDVNPDELMR